MRLPSASPVFRAPTTARFRAHRLSKPVLLPSSRLYSTSLPATCPSCKAPLPTRLPACPNCHYINRIHEGEDFYDILEIPSQPNPFVVAPDELKARFRNLQRYVHPDVWAVHGQDKAEIARYLSSRVNKAYNTLLSPLARIHYILKNRGISFEETDQLDDPVFIEEIMELREALEDAADEEAVALLRQDNKENILATLKTIEELVASADWEGARREAVRLKYLQGIDEAAESWPHPPFNH